MEAGWELGQGTTNYGTTPLYNACNEVHVEVARALIAAGADLDQATTNDGVTPLFIACYQDHV